MEIGAAAVVVIKFVSVGDSAPDERNGIERLGDNAGAGLARWLASSVAMVGRATVMPALNASDLAASLVQPVAPKTIRTNPQRRLTR